MPSYDYPQEIPNTRHVPQPKSYLDMNGREYIPNTKFSTLNQSSTSRGAGAFGSVARYEYIPNTTDPILDAINKINTGEGETGLVDGEGLEVLTGEEKALRELGRMQGLNTMYSHSNKWVGYFPLMNVLGPKYNNLELNLTRFSIP